MGRQAKGSSPLHTVGAAALVAGGCFIGAGMDIWLRFPTAGVGILFVPYGVLTAALCRARQREWWIFLLAAGIGDCLAHRLGGASVAFALSTELVNQLRAVLAAFALSRLAGRSHRLDSLREMMVYLLAAVLLAPGLAALAGAALTVDAGAARWFWPVWQEWWLSNAITALTLLPLLTIDLDRLRKSLRRRPGRIVEGGLLFSGLLVTGAVVFSGQAHPAGAHQLRLYWALPFLLWAAVRFGPRGTSGALLALTALSIWGALAARGPFAARLPCESLVELQVFLLAVSIPVLMMAALITQQRTTAVALADSRRQYRSVVEDQTEMICRFRPDGVYTFANRAYTDAFGLSPGDLADRTVWDLVPAGVHRTRGELAVISAARPLATREVQVVTRAGARAWQQWRDRGFFDDRGAVVEYQAVGRDVTDRKLAEDERRELEARRSVETALRDADRRKDEFLAMLGHELRNPLAPIGLALEILREAAPGSEEGAWAREAIGRQLGYMTRLLDDLLDISRITLGKIKVQLEPLDLRAVIANAVEATRPLIEASGHRLSVTVPDQPAVVHGDAVRLTQAVSNLMNNAAKYTEAGGHIEVALEGGAGGVRLSVRDNGIGLAADALERIFDLFSQIPAEMDRAQGGLGIGLTLARRLVELHGGTVEAHSDGPNRGSEIVVRLPAATDDAPVPVRGAAPASGPHRGSLRILAVDDDVQIADGLARILGLWGHTVRIAHDGADALEVAGVFEPEVVLVDLGLPRVDGLEVARQLRLSGERAPALLISMSGFGQEHARRSSDDAGFHHHMVKPLDMDSLHALLERCLRDQSRAVG
ncbi:MAG TPA: ATP-binding protein [Polyangia bacterium]|nr:ATP-binding protein [Polyangia bacterium]